MKEALEILTLVNALSPIGIELVKALATRLQGRSDDELKVMGDAIDDAIIATAEKELSGLPPISGDLSRPGRPSRG